MPRSIFAKLGNVMEDCVDCLMYLLNQIKTPGVNAQVMLLQWRSGIQTGFTVVMSCSFFSK